jgi:hypothetical protein
MKYPSRRANMNTSYGWIKLYRRLLRHPLWETSTAEQKVLLVALLMMANHAEKKWEWNGRPYYCRPGQMITSLKSLSEKCGNGVTRRKVQTGNSPHGWPRRNNQPAFAD